jgi:broad specificity phosphatase PhoE/mannose-6-phosphate isomerase-like protein (cupin superfamily)
MKWPIELLLIRHAESAYNDLKRKKSEDPEYDRFLKLFKSDRDNPEILSLADRLQHSHALGCSDRETPITEAGEWQARITGRRMRESGATCPDVIFVSPYVRTLRTLQFLTEEWPELAEVKVFQEERIREKDHGLALLYNDWRIYHVKNPEQARLHKLLGEYDYRFLNGENIPDVRQRTHSWMATLTREFAGKRVMAITHHLTILATRANLERLSPEQFLYLDEHEKPVNCGVTQYSGFVPAGSRGKLLMSEYNKKHYTDAEVASERSESPNPEAPMLDSTSFPYETRLDILYPQLEVIDEKALAESCEFKWFNQTLCKVNDSVVRIGIIEGEYHWHKHDGDDEFFYVIEGKLLVDLEDRSFELCPRQGFVVPKGIVHRTRAPQRTVILMVENAGIIPTGD